MRYRRWCSLVILLFFLSFLAWGLVLNGYDLLSQSRDATPKKQLIPVEGPATDVVVSEQSITFQVGGQRIVYERGAPRFDEVVSVVQSGRRLHMGVAQEADAGAMPLYQLRVGAHVVLHYAAVADARRSWWIKLVNLAHVLPRRIVALGFV